MPKPTVIWLLIITFLSSLTIPTPSTNGCESNDAVQKQAIKLKVLRRKDQIAFKPTAKEIQDQKPLPSERILENEIPKDIPVKIRVKKEKEFKDLNNANWARDFELEITNSGDKPIYFVYLLLTTDVKARAGYRIVFPLYFGRAELGEIGAKPQSTDPSIRSGATHGIRIHAGQLAAWEIMNRKENRPHPKRIRVEFQKLHFGDGTGYGPGGIKLPSEWRDRPSSACGFIEQRTVSSSYLADTIGAYPFFKRFYREPKGGFSPLFFSLH